MTDRRRHDAIVTVDKEPLLAAMRHFVREVGRINLQLPIKSPSRAALKSITNQMREVATILTGDPRYFDGKGH